MGILGALLGGLVSSLVGAGISSLFRSTPETPTQFRSVAKRQSQPYDQSAIAALAQLATGGHHGYF